MASRLDDLPAWARDLLAAARVARLGLLGDDDRPRVLPVTFAVCGDAIWSAIDDKPKRVTPARLRYLRRNPAAALSVDHYADEWSELAWVQVLGEIEIADAADCAAALAALEAKYEPYRDAPPAVRCSACGRDASSRGGRPMRTRAGRIGC